MSFECRKCHENLERVWGSAHFDTPSVSYGRCESCGKVGECVDCRARVKARGEGSGKPVSK
jgi:hypothetical protein